MRLASLPAVSALAARRVLRCWMLMLAVVAAHAASPCAIGLRTGSAITVDGNLAGDAGWSDAAVSIISSSGASASPCVEPLGDHNGATATTGNITVYSKRYTRAGAQFLGFLFDVDDASPCAGSTCLGERIIVLLDPNRSGGAALENGGAASAKDYKVEVSHFWDFTGTVRPAQMNVSNAAAAAGICPNIPWDTAGASQPPASFRAVNRGGGTPGYRVEFEVALSLLGNPTADIGIALAVINDTGPACSLTVCPDFASSVPRNIQIIDTDNPVNPCGASWTVPSDWATGFFANPPAGDVTISRWPEWWNSEAVDAFSCGVVNNTYYAVQPCKMTVRMQPNNGAAAGQSRHLLYLFADHSVGTLVWHVIGLQENVSIGPGLHTFESPEILSKQLVGLTGHPCVRVFILPPFFNASFPRDRILSIGSNTDINQMIAAYALQDQHWAQQNISRNAGGSCPLAGCDIITRLFPGPSRTTSRPAAGFGFVPDDQTGSSVERPVSDRNAPPVRNVGRDVRMPADDFKRLSAGNVLVQIRAFGRRTGSTLPDSPYNFAEDLGGVVQVFPVEDLNRRPLPINFRLGNPDHARDVFLQVDVYAPPGVRVPEIRLNTGPFRFEANTSSPQSGSVEPSAAPGVGRLSFGVHAGANFPVGALGRSFDTGLSLAWDLEYELTNHFAVQVFVGREQMDADARVAPPAGRDLHLTHMSGVLRYFAPMTARFRPFVAFGVGIYSFEPGPTNAGIQAAGGFVADLTSRTRFESGFRFHSAAADGDRANFGTWHGGLRFRF